MSENNLKQQNAEHLSQDTKNKVLAFIESDKTFANRLDAFFIAHAEEILELENLRENRNRDLDDAEQGMRRDADLSPRDKVDSIDFGPFRAQKKQQEWFIPATFIELTKRAGVYQGALDSGAICIKTEIDKDNAKEFLRKHSLEKSFEVAKETKTMTTAISGPKIVPPFGAQLKKKQ